MKKIELKCENCGNLFVKELKEYNRQIHKGRKEFFCSRTCAATKNNQNNPRNGNIENLKSDNRRDEHTSFRWFILRSQYRDKKKNYGCNLTLEYLKNLWETQKGICPFTGWNLILPQDSNGWKISNPHNASLDRIDNSIGYIQGNVRFISVMANLARQNFTDDQLVEFCKAVATKVL